MATSDITVSGLTATGDVKGVKLAWTCADPWPEPFNTSLAAVEVWAATSNDRAHGSFAKVGEGQTNFLHAGLNRGDVYYYWIKARDKLGGYGDWHPSGATSGVVGTEVSGDVLVATNGYWKHPSGLIEQWGRDNVPGGATFDFPIAFPTACLNLVGSINSFVAADRTLSLAFLSNTQFVAVINDNAGVPQTEDIYWRALGY